MCWNGTDQRDVQKADSSNENTNRITRNDKIWL